MCPLWPIKCIPGLPHVIKAYYMYTCISMSAYYISGLVHGFQANFRLLIYFRSNACISDLLNVFQDNKCISVYSTECISGVLLIFQAYYMYIRPSACISCLLHVIQAYYMHFQPTIFMAYYLYSGYQAYCIYFRPTKFVQCKLVYLLRAYSMYWRPPPCIPLYAFRPTTCISGLLQLLQVLLPVGRETLQIRGQSSPHGSPRPRLCHSEYCCPDRQTFTPDIVNQHNLSSTSSTFF
jgi:hypothetical protein